MKRKEILSDIPLESMSEDEVGELHVSNSAETPLREDAFDMEDALKIELIEKHFREIMLILGLDLNDDSLSGTPKRVAKMYVTELFNGLDPKNKPSVKLFKNTYRYGEMLVQRNIQFHSVCEHHFVPIVGKAHIAYISSGKVVGLSKINRIVQYYAKRPQVQERMTVQIANEIREALRTEDVAVLIDAKHYCIAARGIRDTSGTTTTSTYYGRFLKSKFKKEFLKYLR